MVDVLTDALKNTPTSSEQDLDATLNALRNVLHPMLWGLEPITESQMDQIITQVQAKKSCGPDGISFYLLKILKPVIKQPLTTLANQMIIQKHWPVALATAKICQVPKKKKYE